MIPQQHWTWDGVKVARLTGDGNAVTEGCLVYGVWADHADGVGLYNEQGSATAANKQVSAGNETLWFGPNGVRFDEGVYADLGASTTEVLVYYRS